MKNNLQKTLSMATEMTKADETGIELIESEQNRTLNNWIL